MGFLNYELVELSIGLTFIEISNLPISMLNFNKDASCKFVFFVLCTKFTNQAQV